MDGGAHGSGGVFWLVSYPKSGNTWLRAFMLNLMEDRGEPVGLEELTKIRYASGRELIDEYAGVETAELAEDEITELRARVYDLIGARARERKATILFRFHEAFRTTPSGAPLISPTAAEGVIYLLRNPLDVAISYAHHFACSVDDAIGYMGDEGHRIFASPDKLHWLPPQYYRSWSDHVASWLERSRLRLLVLRFEDLVRDPHTEFARAAAFAGLPAGRRRVADAVAFSSFDELRRQEQRHGFDERNPLAPTFFRRGGVDDWRGSLTAAQVRRIIGEHRDVMRRFGYVDDDGEAVPQAAKSDR